MDALEGNRISVRILSPVEAGSSNLPLGYHSGIRQYRGQAKSIGIRTGES